MTISPPADPARSEKIHHDQTRAAGRIDTDSEAIAAAHQLADEFAVEASARDSNRSLPFNEVERFSQSGLWAITVRKEFGGPGLSYATLASVTRIISAADASLGQIPQNHFFLVEALRWSASAAQKERIFGNVLRGDRLGNALSERKPPSPDERLSRLVPIDGGWLLEGEKFYSTGVIFADWVVGSGKRPDGEECFAIVARGTPGLQIINDWSGFGQRTTASGTTLFQKVRVSDDAIVPIRAPTLWNLAVPVAHIIHAAIDAGIAKAAVDAAITFLREQARPGIGAGLAQATDDPYTILDIGAQVIQLHAAEALLARAGELIDRASENPSVETAATATIAVYEAKVASAQAALSASNKLIELGGTRSTLSEWNLDRHWRNARTHTVHDPVRWRQRAIGDYWLNGKNPAIGKYVTPVPGESP